MPRKRIVVRKNRCRPPEDAHVRLSAGERRRRAERRGALLAAFLVSSPVLAAPPYRTDDPEPTDYQHFELYAHSTGVNVSGETSGFAPGLEVDYGVLPNTQLSIIAPLAFDRASGTPFHFGYGDTEIGLKFRVIDQDANGWRPAVAVFPTVDIPTGDSRRGLGTGGARMFQPVWLQKDIGDWTINTGGGYSIKSGFGNKNDWFVGLLVQRKITDQLKIGAEIFHQTALEVGGKESTGFNVGAIYDFTDDYHLVASVGRGLQNAKETNQFSWYLGFEATGAWP